MVAFEIKELIVLFTIWVCWTLIVTLVLNWVSEKTIDAVWKRREKKDKQQKTAVQDCGQDKQKRVRLLHFICHGNENRTEQS